MIVITDLFDEVDFVFTYIDVYTQLRKHFENQQLIFILIHTYMCSLSTICHRRDQRMCS